MTEFLMQPEMIATSQADQINIIGDKIITQLRSVHDPEIPVNIYDLGLIYSVDVKPLENGAFNTHIVMTLTTPNCPVAEQMPTMVRDAVAKVEEVQDVTVDLVWEPTWDRSMMSDEARLQLNMF